jgi:hypothetical protein
MSKKLILILMVLLCGVVNVNAAELLVRAKPHWMDSLIQKDVDVMSTEQKQSYESRSQIGDVVVVRPDGWAWGKEECLPNYVVVKVPQMTESEAKKYEESLTEQVLDKDGKLTISKLIRHRKYSLPKTDITSIKTNAVSMTKTALTGKVITKTGLSTEILAPSKDLLSYYWRGIKSFASNWMTQANSAEFLHKHVMPSGGDYTSLEACMNANEQDFTGDGWFTVEIDGTWSTADTTAITIHNYTTTTNDYINIYTTAAARHRGVWSTSYYRLVPTGNVHTILNYVLDLKITGLQIYNEGSGFWHFASVASGTLNLTLDKNIMHGTAASTGALVIDTSSAGNAYIFNNILYGNGGSTSYGSDFRNLTTTVYCYNNTFYNFHIGINTDGTTIIAKNNISYNNSHDFIGTFNATSTNNLSLDTTAPPFNTYYTEKTLTFTSVSAGTEDFHLASTDTDAIDKGVDLSGTFTDDIDGVTRSGTWDIGADEYVAAATTFTFSPIINIF